MDDRDREVPARGVASLRYDKRGAGQSSGDFLQASLSDNYSDAAAATGWLLSRAAGRPVFGIGHSEGADVAHLAADQLVVGAVLIACAARRGEEILTWQAAQNRPDLAGCDDGDPQDPPRRPAQEPAEGLRPPSEDPPPPAFGSRGRESMPSGCASSWTTIHRRSSRASNVPSSLSCPSSTCRYHPRTVNAVCELVSGSCDEVVVPGLSHILCDDPLDPEGPAGYKTALKQPVSPVVLATIADWVTRQLAEPSKDRSRTGLSRYEPEGAVRRRRDHLRRRRPAGQALLPVGQQAHPLQLDQERPPPPHTRAEVEDLGSATSATGGISTPTGQGRTSHSNSTRVTGSARRSRPTTSTPSRRSSRKQVAPKSRASSDRETFPQMPSPANPRAHRT